MRGDDKSRGKEERSGEKMRGDERRGQKGTKTGEVRRRQE